MAVSLPLLLVLVLIAFSFTLTPSLSSDHYFPNCDRNFTCGSLTNITYPFSGGDRPHHCGPPEFHLTCRDNAYAELTSNSITYRVLTIDQNLRMLTLARSDLYDSACPQNFLNTTLDPNIFTYIADENLTLFYNCTLTYKPQNLFTCPVTGDHSADAIYLVGPIPFDPALVDIAYCPIIVTVPVSSEVARRLALNQSTLREALMMGFSVVYRDPYDDQCVKCAGLGSQCRFNPVSNKSVCICRDGPCPLHSTRRKSSNHTKTALAVAGGAIIGCLVLGFAIFACRKRTKRIVNKSPEFGESKTEDIPFAYLSKSLTSSTITTNSTSFSQSIVSSSSSHSETGKTSSYFGIHVFNYIELEKATDNFNSSREIGDGGFGTVFYGRLEDGREVAVKRLYENSLKRVEQFMNEVEILTRLSHVNLVKLYGCTSRRSRELLLVYEYISNGTVADHLFGKRANSGLLSWPIRLSIALETADALTYLHRSDIIHRDVKTTNILLENDFRVKVADFGLSRLFPNDVTHVSTAPQGTPGYVDPEYYQLYHLTEKSDVYSFGVVLAELISSKQAVDITRDRHDINLSNMALNKIHDHKLHELVDPSLGFSTNKSVKKMITSVAEIAFRCLQKERDMRPTMGEVLEALRRIKKGDSIASTVELMDIA